MTVTDLPTTGDAGRHDNEDDLGRWRPSRAGLINIWQYEEETFEFEQGRLVLYGTNGSGKTMALELLFPYLLDANASPSRLSTAGGNERGGLWSRVAGYDDTASRTGYLWAEFSRPGTDGTTEHFTCGTQLRVRAGTKGTQAWFTTSRRVGDDLHLLDATRAPLDTKALKVAIDGHGTVWGSDAGGYRNAVRQTLYSEFRADEYQALIEGLLAVRKQSITDGLTPDRLDTLLTNGLPGLDPGELDQVARGFERLDARRDTIAALDDAVAASRALAGRNRSYARTAMRLLARAVTTAHSRFDDVRRRETAAATTLEETTAAKQHAEARLDELADELTGLRARKEAILASPQYASLDQLESRRAQAETAERHAATTEEAANTASRRAAESAAEADTAETVADTADVAVTAAVGALRTSARTGGLDVDVTDDAAETAERFRDAASARGEAVTAVRVKLGGHATAVSERDRAAADEDDQAEEVTARRNDIAAARATVTEATDQWRHDVAAWHDDLTELAVDVADTVTGADLGGFAAAVADAHNTATVELGRADTRLTAREEEHDATLEVLVTERDELAGVDGTLPPSPAPWRTPRDPARAGRALWSLLDAAPATTSETLDGIEAALEGAGLLDAWVAGDGTVTVAGDIVAVTAGQAPAGRSLADVLTVDVPATEAAGIDPAAVAAMLAAVPVVDDVTEPTDAAFAVTTNGLFRAGPAVGHVPARPARHIGAAARERARQERIAELDGQIDDCRSALEQVRRDRATIGQRRAVADTERNNAPRGDAVEAARGAVDVADARLADAEERLAAATVRREAAEADVQAAFRALNQVAAQHGLPTDPAELDKVTAALRQVERDASTVTATATEARSARREAVGARRLADERAGDATAAADIAEKAAGEAIAARNMYDQLEQSVGADAKAAAEQLETVNKTITARETDHKNTTGQLRTLDREEGNARGVLEATSDARAVAETVRERAVTRFRRALDTGLGADADLAVDVGDVPTLTAAVTAAGTVREATSGNPTAATLSRELQALEDERFRAQAVLGGRADLTITVVEDDTSTGDGDGGDGDDGTVGDDLAVVVSVASATVEGTPVPFHAMLERFEVERDRARNELAADEARLFEDTLTGSLRTHLASRLRAAQSLVDGMNALLGQIRSASGGVAVSLRWDVDDDIDDQATLTRAKQLLLKDHHTSDERDMLFGFLTRRIETVRADESSTASWREALEALFDYRRWHSFRVMVRHDRFGERAVPFTSRKVSLSAGEKALVMSLPLFAAVAAHYMPRDVGGPEPRCPRLLLLDEVFPKNDRENKRQILGLLTDLRLDCVLTSDKDMCDYDTVDGIAIAVIAKDGDRSYATRLVWNGTRIVDAPVADTGRPGTTRTLL